MSPVSMLCSSCGRIAVLTRAGKVTSHSSPSHGGVWVDLKGEWHRAYRDGRKCPGTGKKPQAWKWSG